MSEPFETTIDSSIFNYAKTDYETPHIFMGQQAGLLDTVNKPFPKLERLYKKLKALDWDELEFDYGPCNLEFKRMKEAKSKPMINQLGWQWETDSIASRTVAPIMSGFLTHDMPFQLYQRIGDNEVVHGRTYAEIVKFSFDDPASVMKDILEKRENALRLETISKVFAEAYQVSHKLALGELKRNQETFNVFMLYIVAMFIMERLQFMTSFSMTFAYGEQGHFLPICKAVQKICQDEYEIHSVAGAVMLDLCSQTSEGLMANYQLQGTIAKMLEEAVAAEINHNYFLMNGQSDIFGVTANDFEKWALFNAADVYSHLRIKHDFIAPKLNPLSYMENWMKMSSIQAALQEEKNGSYLLGMVRRDDANSIFSIEGL